MKQYLQLAGGGMTFHLVKIHLNFMNFIAILIEAHIFCVLPSQVQSTHRLLNCHMFSTLQEFAIQKLVNSTHESLTITKTP